MTRQSKIIFIIIFLMLMQCLGCTFSNNGKRLDNHLYLYDEFTIYQIYSSEDKKNTIYSMAKLYDEPEIYIGEGETAIKITDNEFIEFDAVINNDGDYAYALSEYSVDSSKVYLNSNLIKGTDNGRLNKNLEINNKYLVYSYETDNENGNFVSAYNLQNNTIKDIEIDMHVQKMKFIGEEKILVQGWNPENLSMDISIYDIENNKIEKLFNSDNDEIIKEVNNKEWFKIDVLSGDCNARYLFNALYELFNYQVMEPFSSSNNFMGRISWNQSYRLEGLLRLYELSKDNQVKDRINLIVKNLIKIQNSNLNIQDKYNPGFLYASKKYSLDKDTPISLLIDNSRIYYPLLLAVNMDLIEDNGLKDKVIQDAENMFEYFENYYNKNEKLYHFQYGMAFWADGLWVPYNQQNMFGLVLIELYKATDKSKYKERVYDLAKKFKSGFEYTDDGNLVWHYWPDEFYSGWDEEDNLSLNTPSKEADNDELYEDVSHAGLNVKFMIEFYKTFGDEVITDKDINEVNSTLNNLIKDKNFPYYISGNVEYIKPYIKYIPKYGWSELDNLALNELYLNLIPKINPDFDSENIFIYLNAIHDCPDTQKLKIETHEFNSEQKLLKTSVDYYYFNYNDIKKYF